MTSKQVLLTLATLCLCFSGCTKITANHKGAEPLISPYAEHRVWAVVPLRNESGSQQVDGAALADQLSRQLENASNIDVLAVNRVLAAMEALELRQIASPADAMKLMQTLQVDALVLGTVTTYDPYDPPKVGMAIELYANPRGEQGPPVDVRNLSSAATERDTRPPVARIKQPVSSISAYLDAADPHVRRDLEQYATRRRVEKDPDFVFQKDAENSARTYRISMDLYSEFVSYVMSWRLLKAERERLGSPSSAQAAH